MSQFADACPREWDGAEMSQRDVARALGITPTYVHQIETRALRKLRMAMARQGLTYESLAPQSQEASDG
jgi:DNA-directed RNA polymerase sigma subunit (sigma70/sigma32)